MPMAMRGHDIATIFRLIFGSKRLALHCPHPATWVVMQNYRCVAT